MARPKIPNQKSKYKALKKRLNGYTLLVQAAMINFINDAVNILYTCNYEGQGLFDFDSNPITKGQIAERKNTLISTLFNIFITGTAIEWAESNKVQDTVADKVVAAYGGNKIDKWYQDNNDKLKTFQSRVYSGRTTHDRLIEISNDAQKELESVISVCKDKTVPVIASYANKYFSDPDSLRADFKKKYGITPSIKDSSYHAQTLVSSEINMAYRNAEQERWLQFDFVVCYEIKLSATHHERMPKGDICDLLAGKYPKWFRWTCWHLHDLCYAIPILKTEDEFFNDKPSKNEIKDVPDAMKQWIGDNTPKIISMQDRGKLPYWLKDNDYRPYLNFSLEGRNETEVLLIQKALSNPLNYVGQELSLSQISQFMESNPTIITEDIYLKNGVYRSDRAAMHKNVVKEYIGDCDAKSDYVYMLGGAPANGKSTLVDSGKLPHPQGALVIDADKVKSKIGEYMQMVNSGDKMLVEAAANFVHEESSVIGKMIQKEAFSRDIAVVIDGVNGGSIDKVAKKVADIKAMTGKKVRADYVTLDTDLSVKLAKARAEKTGRMVPIEFVENSNRNIAELVPKLIEKDVFDELYLWDTNVNGTPRLILKMVNGELEIADKKLYERFLAKNS